MNIVTNDNRDVQSEVRQQDLISLDLTMNIDFQDCKNEVEHTELTSQKSVLGASSIARFAQRLVSSKYSKAHIILVGADIVVSSHGSTTRNETFETDETDRKFVQTSSQSLVSAEENSLAFPQSKVLYRIFEILPGGTLIDHDNFVVSGSGSESILALMTDYYAKKEAEVIDNSNNLEKIHMSSKKKNFWDKGCKREKCVSNISIDGLLTQVNSALKLSMSLDHRSGGYFNVFKYIARSGLSAT